MYINNGMDLMIAGDRIPVSGRIMTESEKDTGKFCLKRWTDGKYVALGFVRREGYRPEKQ